MYLRKTVRVMIGLNMGMTLFRKEKQLKRKIEKVKV